MLVATIRRSKPGFLLIVLGICAAILGGELIGATPIRGGLAFVSAPLTTLFGVPEEKGVPSLGELKRGTALIVEDTKGDYSLVKLSAWVKSQDLSSERPGGRTEPLDPEVEAQPPESSTEPNPSELPPLTDLQKARRCHGVAERLELPDGKGPALELTYVFTTFRGQRVEPTEGSIEVELVLHRPRTLPGGVVRGAVFWSSVLVLRFPERRLVIPASELPDGVLPLEFYSNSFLALGETEELRCIERIQFPPPDQ